MAFGSLTLSKGCIFILLQYCRIFILGKTFFKNSNDWQTLDLSASADEQDDGEELLVALILLLFLQHQHEVMAETRLHHHPVHSSWQVNVCGQEDDVLSLKGGDALVGVHEMGHHGFQGPLPLAGSTRTRARVGTVFTDVFMLRLLGVVQGQGTARGRILQGQKAAQ